MQTFDVVSEQLGGWTLELGHRGTQSEDVVEGLGDRVEKTLHVFGSWTDVLNHEVESFNKLFAELVELFKFCNGISKDGAYPE